MDYELSNNARNWNCYSKIRLEMLFTRLKKYFVYIGLFFLKIIVL